MARISIPSRDEAAAASQPLLDAVGAKLGVIPNVFRLIGTSPAALDGFLGFNGALGKALDVKTRERIALAVAQANGCDYCLSAHTFLGLNLAKIDQVEIALNRRGQSSDAKAAAAVKFALDVVENRGRVSDSDMAAVRLAGFADAQVIAPVGAEPCRRCADE